MGFITGLGWKICRSRGEIVRRAAWIAVLCCISCGYSFGETRVDPQAPVIAVAVPVFEDRSTTMDAATCFTTHARREIARRAGLKLGPAGAEYSLVGKIVEINSPLGSLRTRGTGYQSLSYELSARVEVALLDRSGLVLRERTVEDTMAFPGGPYPERTEADRRRALDQLARRMMRKAIDDVMERF